MPPAASVLARLPRPLARAMEDYVDRLDVEQIQEAHDLAVRAHRGQKRASGEDYVTHTIDVATIIAGLKLDTSSIVAGLVHDTVEDTAVTVRELEERFGKEVAQLVDGVTKIGKVQFRSHTEAQVENYRKLLLSMADDARVILVKLADRLHNMRTLHHLPEEKRRRIARETREIYAPLAHRLGIFSIKWELEDLCFKYLEPEAYADLTRKVRERRNEREEQIRQMHEPLVELLREAGIPAEVTGRPKHLWSIYKKMQKRDLPYEQIYDLMAMRVITDTLTNCYAALGMIHSKWAPVQDRFHDYVATPKSNMYQSVHTTVVGPGGRRYEIQIRTEEMHRTAEYGIAAHWKYKEGRKGNDVDEALMWFRQVLEWQQDTSEPEEFMEFLRMDLFQGEIFVFTPKGEVKQLPAAATPIDFAFSVHTEVGLHCAGAKVNGRIAPLSRELQNGDTVEILTNPRQWPTRDWLNFVKTSRARGRIRQWIRRQEFEQAHQIGKEFLARELRKQRLDLPKSEPTLTAVATKLGLNGWDYVYEALGRGDIGPSQVIRELFPDHDPSKVEDRAPSTLQRLAQKLVRTNKGVRIQGMDNLMVRYSQCCQPVPGDRVIGYITRGRGVSIHRSDCPNILALPDPERRVEIEWAAEKGDRFMVKIQMKGTDRRGLLSDVAMAITNTGTNIQHADMRAVEDGMDGRFVVEVQDLGHLEKVLKAIERVKGVIRVERRESFEETDLD